MSPYTDFSTAWMSDPARFYREIEKFAGRPVLEIHQDIPQIQLKVGDRCHLRGPCLSTAYDKFVDGTVVAVTHNFKFPDGRTSDRIVAKFIDPADPTRSKLVGTFWKLFGEVCGVGQEHLVRHMSGALFIDMVRTRLVWTHLLANVWDHKGETIIWYGPLIVPAFIEGYVMELSCKPKPKLCLDVKFIHLRGGLTSPHATAVQTSRPFCTLGDLQELFKIWAGGFAKISDVVCMRRRLGGFGVADARRWNERIHVETPGNAAGLRGVYFPFLECGCGERGTDRMCWLT